MNELVPVEKHDKVVPLFPNGSVPKHIAIVMDGNGR
jgi:undecaprenyl pyrophosphate synthase